MKVHCEFLYEAAKNLKFKFNGDDDVYLFIDNKLVLDIGGAHLKKDGNVDLNEVAENIGLIDGEIYSFDFFYIERHTTASNLTIETNMIFEQADAKPSIVYKDEKGKPIEEGRKVPVSEEVGVEYSVKAGNDGMSNITFKDDKLDVEITAPMHKYTDNGRIELVDEKTAVLPVVADVDTVEKKFPYTVKYVDKDTGKEIADKKISNGDYKKKITESAINIKNYKLCDDENKTITIGKNGNEIIFYYSNNKNNNVSKENSELKKATNKVEKTKKGNSKKTVSKNTDSNDAEVSENSSNILSPKTGYFDFGTRLFVLLAISATGVILSVRKIKKEN